MKLYIFKGNYFLITAVYCPSFASYYRVEILCKTLVSLAQILWCHRCLRICIGGLKLAGGSIYHSGKCYI